MGYWSTVTIRALALAAKDAKVDSVSGALISLAAQTVIAVSLLFVVGLTDAAIWVRVFTFCAPYALLPMIFLVRLLQVPAAMHARQDVLIRQLKTSKSEAERRQKIIEGLTYMYLNEPGRPVARNSADDAIIAGLDLPPEAWLNEKLGERGEGWTIFNVRGQEYQTFEVVGPAPASP